MSRMKRYWINQPSTLQQGHKYHGINVLADTKAEEGNDCEIYFIKGSVTNMRMVKSALSKGWVNE